MKIQIKDNNFYIQEKYHFLIFFLISAGLALLMVSVYKGIGHDYFFHQQRFSVLIEALREGTFPNYIDYNAINGYGYLTKAFYSDFILIPFALIGLIIGVQDAYILMIYVMTLLCGVFMYKAVISIYKNTFIATVSALLYTFAYYRLLDLYRRAALGEALSFTFLPIVLLGTYYITKGNYKKWYILAIGFSLMALTHVISTVLAFIVLIIFLFIYFKELKKEPKRIYYLFLAGGVTIFISAYFLLPIVEQLISNKFYFQITPVMPINENKLDLFELIWGLFYGVIQSEQFFITGIGFLITIPVLLRVFIYEKNDLLRETDKMALMGIIFILICSTLFPWSIFPFNTLNFIQFSWRFFEFVTLFFAIAGAYYLSMLLTTRNRKVLALAIVCISISLFMVNDGIDYRNKTSFLKTEQTPTLENKFHLIGLEYLPANVPSISYLVERGDKIVSSTSANAISRIKRERNQFIFDINDPEKDILELPLTYYKGYFATINDKEVTVSQSENGLVEIAAEYPGNVKVFYKGTIIQKLGYYTTILSIFALSIYILLFRRKTKAKQL